MLNNDYGEVHHVKWIVYSIVKGKDVIFGQRYDMLEKKEGAIWHNFPLATTSLAYVGFQSYETLFSFLHVPINPKNHWSDFVGWTMVECLHKQVFKNLKEVNINVIFSIFKITMNSNFLLQWRLHCIWNYLKFGFDTHWRLLAPQGIHSLKFSN